MTETNLKGARTASRTKNSSPKRIGAQAEKPGRDLLRLLAALGRDGGASGRRGLRDGFVVIAARRNGVTSIVANIPCEAADEAVAKGLACWRGAGEASRLELSPEGEAYARRCAAPAGLEPFRAQHMEIGVRILDAGGPALMVDESESPLAWLARRKDRNGQPYINAAQFAAGHRFGRDVACAQILPRVTSDWSGQARSPDSGPRAMTPGETALAARQRLDRAACALGGEFNNLLIDVCGFQKRLELVERERGWPARAGKLVLRLALDRLADHYGLASEAQGPDPGGRIRTWGASDYRPSIDAADAPIPRS